MNSTLRRCLCVYVACGAAAMLAGCASVKTVPGGGTPDAIRMRRPAEINVRPFETNGGMWQGDAAEPAKRGEIRDWLTGSLLRHLAPLAPTYLLEGEPAPTSGWLVTGRFLRINPGSRTGRIFLGGVGAGASKLETQVYVFDLAVSSTEPILTFTTTGGSNLAAGIPGAMTAVEDDIERTAREIYAYLESRLWPADGEQGQTDAPMAIDEVKITPPPRRTR